MKHMTTNGFDECYTGTGPAAEVANGWGTPSFSDVATHAGQATQGQPTYAELLAQRDELAAKLEIAKETLVEVGKFYGAAGQFARAALSRIKGA